MSEIKINQEVILIMQKIIHLERYIPKGESQALNNEFQRLHQLANRYKDVFEIMQKREYLHTQVILAQLEMFQFAMSVITDNKIKISDKITQNILELKEYIAEQRKKVRELIPTSDKDIQENIDKKIE